MHVRRGPLFWGLLLTCLGAIPLLVRGGYLDAARFAEAWRLWPLLLVAIGLSVLLGRGRGGLVGTVVLALVIGTIGGGALASGGALFGSITDCAAVSGSLPTTTNSGTFDGGGSVTIELSCGSATVDVVEGHAWTLQAGYRNQPPIVTATATSLVVRAPEGVRSSRQEWTLHVPATSRSINLTANAASSTLDLHGAALDRLDADLDAGDLRIDASGGTIGRLEVSLNAGRVRITLGGTATTGSLSANAGAIDLCVAPAARLVLHLTDQLTFGHNLDDRGLARDRDTWTRPGSGGPTIDLEIEGNAASLTLDPEGGC
jgi:hypothetical protein